MTFAHLNFLWLLLVLPPALGLFFWWGNRVRQRLLVRFVEARLLPSLTAGLSPARRQIRFGLIVAAVALLVIALARPQYGYDKEEVQQNGLDVVVAVDTSKSMLATDIAPTRLARAKLAALQLMQRATTDRLGLVAFAGSAFLECPLTIDNTAFQQSVQALDVNTISEGGTALADAINVALTAFKEKGNHKALVLLTDGEDNDEGALDAAKNAAKEGLKIFTIGIGTTVGALLNPDLVRDPDGNAVKSHLNEALLKAIAEATGGFYLPLRGANTMDLLYDNGLAPLPKADGASRVIRRYHEQYHWPLAAALLLLLAEMFLPERRPVTAGATAKAAAIVVLATVFFRPTAAQASSTSAWQDYQAGQYTNALAEFTRLAAVHTNDLRLVFNAGDAAYRATNFDEAENLFTQAAMAQDLKLQAQAYYNLGNVRFQKAKLAKDLDGLQAGLESAARTYAQSVSLNTNDADAIFNLRFANQAVEQIKKFKEAMRRAKGEADSAVRRAEFHRALEIMEPLQQTLAAKQFEEFTKKLKQIDEIATPPPTQP